MENFARVRIYSSIDTVHPSLFGVERLARWCVEAVSAQLTPRTAARLLNEAAAVSELVSGKAGLVRPLLHWAGDNIATLRDRWSDRI